MKHYLFSIVNNRIDEFDGEVDGTSSEYQHIEKSFGAEEIYCRIENGEISSIICEAFTQKAAEKAVKEYLGY